MKPSANFLAAILTIQTCSFGATLVSLEFMAAVTFLAPLWFCSSWGIVRLISRKREQPNVGSLWIIQFGVLVIIITSAVLAPVKFQDTVLERKVFLNSTNMTMQELSEYALWNRSSFPIRLSEVDDSNAVQARIQFPRRTLTLGEFIRAIEDQTSYRHRMSGGCGNAYTILYGQPRSLLLFELQ